MAGFIRQTWTGRLWGPQSEAQKERVRDFLARGKKLTGFRSDMEMVQVSDTSWVYMGHDMETRSGGVYRPEHEAWDEKAENLTSWLEYGLPGKGDKYDS